jgi:hypothetical protein
MTEKQEAQFRKLIEYEEELARQHNGFGDMRTARGAELGLQAVLHVCAERHRRRR